MKCRYLVPVVALVLSTSTHAALIDNGRYTTDNVSGLDWLDLSETANMTYSQALANQNGWRYATNLEVESIFNQMFSGYYETSNGASDSRFGAYSNQYNDTINFISLFGPSYSTPTADYAYGYYYDESSILRIAGAVRTLTSPEVTIVYGMDYIGTSSELSSRVYDGTYLVRTSVVPIPAAVWLFGSGLLALAGFSRRNKISINIL